MNIFKTFLTGAIAVSAVCMFTGFSTTKDAGSTTVKDADGNVYKTIKIGKQVWMAENLRTTTFNDGTPIPRVTEASAWKSLTTPGYCYYNNSTNVEDQKKWGALYNWYAVKTGGLAPKGWRVPTDDDWNILENYLVANGHNYDGSKEGNKIAKSTAAKTDWKINTDAGTTGNNPASNNSSGFSALPGGSRTNDGNFINQSSNGSWWSATETNASYAYTRYLYYGYENLDRNYNSKSCGFSLRLVRDFN